MFTCALHYSKSKADRLKLLVAHMDSSDVEIGATEIHQHKPRCETASNSWMHSVTDVISVIIGREVSVCIDGIVPKRFHAISPLCRHKIIGDGNCLFRTMSAFCIGTERYHNSVCNSIVKFMQLPNNCNIFCDQFGFGPNLVYTSVNDTFSKQR